MLKLGITQKTHFNSKKGHAGRRQTRVDNFIALWHYHPAILKKDNADDFWYGHGHRQLRKMISKDVFESLKNAEWIAF